MVVQLELQEKWVQQRARKERKKMACLDFQSKFNRGGMQGEKNGGKGALIRF